MKHKTFKMGLVDKVSTLGDLKESGWKSVSIKEEMIRNRALIIIKLDKRE